MEIFDKNGNEININDSICTSLKNNLRVEVEVSSENDYYNEASFVTVKLYFNNELISEDTERLPVNR